MPNVANELIARIDPETSCVSLYSTFGGTTGCTVLVINPSRSMWRKVCVIIFWLMPSTNSLRQRGEAIMVARQRGTEPTGAAAVVAANDGAIYRHARLGGTLNFYYRQAA